MGSSPGRPAQGQSHHSVNFLTSPDLQNVQRKNFKRIEVRGAQDFPAAFENRRGTCPEVESSHRVPQTHGTVSRGQGRQGLTLPLSTVRAQLPLALRGSDPATQLQGRASPGRPGTRAPRPPAQLPPGDRRLGRGRPQCLLPDRFESGTLYKPLSTPSHLRYGRKGPPPDAATRPCGRPDGCPARREAGAPGGGPARVGEAPTSSAAWTRTP